MARAGSEEVGVESPVVGLVPQGGRHLALEDVTGHEEQDRVVVGDGKPPGDPMKRGAGDREGGEQCGDDEEEAATGAHAARVCPRRARVYRAQPSSGPG